MQPIAAEFTEGNYRYTQIERQGDYAIYAQTHKHAPVTRYEVVRIRVMAEHTWPNGQTTPVHEAYPSSSTWGTHGWTCYTLPEARALLAEKQAAQEAA